MSPRADEAPTWPDSLWADLTAPRRGAASQGAAPLRGDHVTETVIVGGGFSGLSTAWHLARRGRRVTLLEAAGVGWGASGRNNGQVIPTLSAIEPDAMVERFGEAGERLARLVGGSADLLFRLVDDAGIDCEQEQSGWFQPAHSPGRVRLSERRVEAWRRFGAPAELLGAEATRELLGSDAWHGGMLNPTGGHVNPLALARGLAAAAEREGVTIYERSPVIGYAREGAGWRVDTDAGTVRCDALVLATNAYTDASVPDLAPALSRSIVPVLSWQMATEPLGDNLRQVILPGRQAVSDTRADLRFFRYDARHRLVTGGAVLGRRRAAERVREIASKRLTEAFPALDRPAFTHVWSGRIGMTRDRYPHIHRLGPDLYAWTGCNGRGVALSVALGRELAAAVDGVSLDELALPLTEPEPIPLHALVRRIAPAMLAWYKRRDRVEPE